MSDVDWESWLLEDAGDPIIEKKADQGPDTLTPAEQLTYCLWVADYGMRNAGDLETAADLYPPFKMEAAEIAARLGLSKTSEAFNLSDDDLQQTYFDRFDGMCAEISEALGVPPRAN
ncbi:hypothetical protein [Sphingomonas bacterium]|uniref:hypothetical protein n=1 Tax=Sphingomonas bacterium TaxID=1895847 RepID=UPI00261217D0|nr:hypothetical protein [Sphingomonas bacterium]MDB5677358.1 hypothetical protein [Sphingomonas bacterium]